MDLGLSSAEARTRLLNSGLNKLPTKQGSSLFTLLLSQFNNFLVWLLLIAAIISLALGDNLDGILILTILLLNGFLGFWQEYKASKELEALRAMEVVTVRVLRDHKEVEIHSYEITPGDVVILESGDKIPADGTILESFGLTVNEAALTGESQPIIKSTSKEDSLVYFGSIVVSGRGKILIDKTGINTKFGKIALTLSEVIEEPTPLETSLRDLSKKIGLLAIFIAVVLFVIRNIQNHDILDAFFTSVAMIVAAVPEGLPAVITVLLSLGVRKMYKKKTIIRKMSAIESLGATSVVLIDKTGTITKNKMSVRKVQADKKDLSELIKASIVCNSASLLLKEGSVDFLGDTTEGALLLWAKDQSQDIDAIRRNGKIITELPFDLERRRMTVLWQEKDRQTVYTKGSPEVILSLCNLSETKLKKLSADFEKLAGQGLRILAVAKSENPGKDLEKNLQFLGFLAIADAPREEAKQSVQKLSDAGIVTIMITGDNELTAKAIAEEVGLLKSGDEVLTGAQLDELTEEQLSARIEKIKVFARVLPEHKLRIVRAFQKLGKVVAVTGDGVNDSLALKQAHVGVAMGITGTDVAKEAADIIILDDNLETIVKAIEEGRLIYSNILKTVRFLMTGNLSEVLVIVGAAVLGFPTPLLPAQILWINFVTDGFPVLSLAADPASPQIMNEKPRDLSKSILGNSGLKFILGFGGVIATISLIAFAHLSTFFNVQLARNAVFTGTVVMQMTLLLFMRRHHKITSNKYLLFSIGLVLLMQLAIISIPELRTLFKI